MKFISYLSLAMLLFAVILVGCNNQNLTSPTANTEVNNSDNSPSGNTGIKPTKTPEFQMDGCSFCTVTYHCVYVGTTTPFSGAYIDIYQGSTYITSAGPTDSGGDASLLVGSFPTGSYHAYAHSPSSPVYDYTGDTTFTHVVNTSYTVPISMYQIDK